MATEGENQPIAPDNTDSNQRSPMTAIYSLLGGTALGILVLLIPITYGKFDQFGLVQAGIAFLLILSCGLLSMLLGEKFTSTVTRMLNGLGL